MKTPSRNSDDKDAAPHRSEIRKEQLTIVASRMGTLAVIEIVFATPLIAALLWEVCSLGELVIWLSLHLAIAVWHGSIYLRSRQGEFPSQLALELVASFLVQGLYWSVLLPFMFVVTPGFIYHLYIFIFLGTMGVLALTLLAEHLFAFHALMMPPAIALSLQSIFEGDAKHIGLGSLGALCILMLILFARSLNRGSVDALAMRYSIADLAHEAGVQRDLAERANVAKSKFLAAASHDLRQPMHALTLLTRALHDTAADADVRLMADDILTTVHSLEKMFDSLLDVSRLDAGVLAPVRRHFELDKLLRRVAIEFTSEAQLKGLKIECQCDPSIAFSDPLLIERIVRNLIANAVRYTRVGTITVACRSETLNGASVHRVEVRDTGIGIPAEQLGQIFDEFHQLNNPERDRTKGLGLGLAIVRRIAKLLDHPIDVSSEQNEGSSFSILVPTGDRQQLPTEQMSADLSANLRGLRVLVIDDDATIRDSTRRLLSIWGCHCVAAGSEDEAVTQARKAFETIDVAIVDYRLRDNRTGVEAIARLRGEFGSDIPALIVSGDTAPERLKEVSASGHTMVHKPLQPPMLRAFLANTSRSLRS